MRLSTEVLARRHCAYRWGVIIPVTAQTCGLRSNMMKSSPPRRWRRKPMVPLLLPGASAGIVGCSQINPLLRQNPADRRFTRCRSPEAPLNQHNCLGAEPLGFRSPDHPITGSPDFLRLPDTQPGYRFPNEMRSQEQSAVLSLYKNTSQRDRNPHVQSRRSRTPIHSRNH